MEQSSIRLYSGPLSQAARKILAVLREQSLQETGHSRRRYLYDHRQMERFYGSQRESWAQSSWMRSEEESKDRDTERHWSRPSSSQQQSSQTSACYQYSQTPSQASSCWDSTPQRETDAYNQCSQREHYETPAHQPGQTLSSSQREVTEAAALSFRREGRALSLQTPRSVFESSDTPWRTFDEEFRPSFTLTLSPDVEGPDEILFPATVQQITRKEELSFTSQRVLSCFKIHEETCETTSGAQEEQRGTEAWRGRIHLPLRQESHRDALSPVKKVAWEEGTRQKLSLEHEMQDGNIWMETRHRDETLLNEKRSAKGTETWLLNINKAISLEQNLTPCPVRIMDKSLDFDTEGEKPREEEKVVFESEKLALGGQRDSPERKDHSMSLCPADNTQDMGQIGRKTGENPLTERPPEQCETHDSLLSDNLERTREERAGVMDVTVEVETGSSTEDGAGTSSEDKMETGQHGCSDIKLTERECERDDKEVSELPGGDSESGERDESVLLHVDWKGRRSCCTLTLSQESRAERSTCVHQSANGSIRGSSSSVALASARTSPSGQSSSSEQGLDLSVMHSNKNAADRTQRPLILLKQKHRILHQENAQTPPKIFLPKRRPKWEPPRSQEQSKDIVGLEGNKLKTSTPELPQTEESHSLKSGKVLKNLRALKQSQQFKRLKAEEICESTPANSEPPKCKRAKCDPDQGRNGLKETHTEANGGEPQHQPRTGSLTASLTSDPRVKDSGKMNSEERMQVLAEVGKAKVLVLTLVYRDGTTQLDPEQKLSPPVCGLLVLMRNNLDCSTPEDSLGPNDSLVYLKLEHTPAWAQQHTHLSQERFTRDMLLQVLSGLQLVVCYKAKDLLRTALQVYRGDLSWKQVAGSHIQDPQVSAWLLDPANPSSCYQELLQKHCRRPCVTPALGTKKVSQVISGLCLLPWLNTELCSKLQSCGLWELYACMELKMISVLAAMESHRIHVDRDALKTTSDLLGTKMKQLEQEAHRAAGQIFLLTSNAQLRTVLFEKLCLHERCENKKLPKTVNKQQQSTSEAALLQLQDLHPLPKIILEYRQVHKIKSTFVDGILSCMMSKNYISSTWHQTSVVTGRISAKHPNFQALPRQPLQITRQQHIQGKEEVVTVHPRAMFIPQDGWTFLAADFCQVELRLLAHLSCDPELLRVFINPRADVFTMLASQWKRVSEDKVTTEDREHAKRIVYSVVYGAGRERLSGILGVSAEQASRFQDSFLQTYKEVQTFIQRTIQQCHKQGYVLSIMGRRRTLPNINSPDWGIRMQAERQAVNFVVQGSAADLCKMAMIRIFHLVSSSSSLSARLLAQLHDELLFEVEDSQVEQFAALVRSTMESLQHIDQLGVHLKVPLKVAVSSGKSWGSMSEL